MKILLRLWRQEQRNKTDLDHMDDDAICKICMDAPVRVNANAPGCGIKIREIILNGRSGLKTGFTKVQSLESDWLWVGCG